MKHQWATRNLRSVSLYRDCLLVTVSAGQPDRPFQAQADGSLDAVSPPVDGLLVRSPFASALRLEAFRRLAVDASLPMPSPFLLYGVSHHVRDGEGREIVVSGWLDVSRGVIVSEDEALAAIGRGSEAELRLLEQMNRWATKEKLRSRISGRSDAVPLSVRVADAAAGVVAGRAFSLPDPPCQRGEAVSDVVLSPAVREAAFGGWSLPQAGSACCDGAVLPAGAMVVSVRGMPAGVLGDRWHSSVDGRIVSAVDGRSRGRVPVDIEGDLFCLSGRTMWRQVGGWRDEPPGWDIAALEWSRSALEAGRISAVAALLRVGAWFGSGERVPEPGVFPAAIAAERWGGRDTSSVLVSAPVIDPVGRSPAGVVRPPVSVSAESIEAARRLFAEGEAVAAARRRVRDRAAPGVQAWCAWAEQNVRLVTVGCRVDGVDTTVEPFSPERAWGSRPSLSAPAAA